MKIGQTADKKVEQRQLALRWQDIDLKEGVLKVTQSLSRTKEKGLVFEEPKTDKSKRTIPLPDAVTEAIHRHRTQQLQVKLLAGQEYVDNDLVFCTNRGTPIYPGILPGNFTS